MTKTMNRTSTTAYCRAWGAARNARCVYGLSKEERQAIKAGAPIYLTGCPPVNGVTERRIVEINGRFYARLPK
jgi:hypothetical protein